MRQFLRPTMPPRAGWLFGIWALLARPRAGRAVEAAPGGVVRQFLDGPEDCALQRAREQQPPPADVAMLRVRRLLFVDQAPGLIEDLLAGEAGQQGHSDRYGREQQLDH